VQYTNNFMKKNKKKKCYHYKYNFLLHF